MTQDNQNNILVGEINMTYYRCGQGKEIVILLHGNGGSSKDFYDFMQTTDSNRYKVYAIDSRGHGGSDCGDVPYSIKTFAIDIIRFINLKGFTKVSLVGYSDGANVCMYLAKIAPELVKSMILISGNLYANGQDKKFFRSIKIAYSLNSHFIKISKRARQTNFRLALMLNNIGVYPEDLIKFNFPTLVIDASKDLILPAHTSLIARNIAGSESITLDGTHFSIITSLAMYDTINVFLNKVNYSFIAKEE